MLNGYTNNNIQEIMYEACDSMHISAIISV